MNNTKNNLLFSAVILFLVSTNANADVITKVAERYGKVRACAEARAQVEQHAGHFREKIKSFNTCACEEVAERTSDTGEQLYRCAVEGESYKPDSDTN